MDEELLLDGWECDFDTYEDDYYDTPVEDLEDESIN